jgi:YidC/Oxa1 family membrane protein insertase
VSDPQNKRKLSHEVRIVLASLLSMAVILLWAKYFGPKPPLVSPQANRPAQSAPATTPQGTPGTSNAPAQPGSASPRGSVTGISAVPAAKVEPRGETQERTLVVENDLYRVEFSNHGAVVKSWQLKKYTDDAKPPRVLDVVHPEAAQQTGGWPFALALGDEQLETAANTGLYQISSPAQTLHAPSDAEFTWSDGHLEVSKHFHFDHTYVVKVETSVKWNGAPVTAGLAWFGGFGDLTVANPAPIDTVSVFYDESGGKLTNIMAKKLEGPEKWAQGVWQGGKDWAGIQDRYFAAAFLPPNTAAPGSLETRYWKVAHTVKVEDKEIDDPVPQIATASSAQPLALRVYVGPKDYDGLKKITPPLHSLVNFGWFEIIADPLFHALKWLHGYIPNWGWAIVVLTLIINMILFPLKYTGYKTSLKMQRVAPEIRNIQEKYKKYSMRDPRKAEMNKEVMAVYSREGINPVGGCIPQLLQMPIWFGLYRALQGTIEMRHAPWLWIKDLSAKDPYFILPVLMGLSMYFASKMTPMTATDPQQQAMMKFMPIGMSVMFFVIPYPSGLAVYILTSGLVGVAQQWWLNRTHPLPAPAKPVRGKNGKNKKQ